MPIDPGVAPDYRSFCPRSLAVYLNSFNKITADFQATFQKRIPKQMLSHFYLNFTWLWHEVPIKQHILNGSGQGSSSPGRWYIHFHSNKCLLRPTSSYGVTRPQRVTKNAWFYFYSLLSWVLFVFFHLELLHGPIIKHWVLGFSEPSPLLPHLICQTRTKLIEIISVLASGHVIQN